MTERKSRILIVDDERPNVQVLNAILQDDYEISVALNGEQALKRAFGEKKPDLVLLDIQMPDLDGFEVCRRLQEHPETRDIPVIFITAKSNEKDEEKGLAAGAVDYITKPFGPAVVLARIRVHLELKRKRDILRNLSNKDGLTCIANRRRFEEFLEFEWQRAVRSGEPLSLVMADIDHFKLYNDHYGHAAGDECLREVARSLSGIVSRQTDLVARYGGEEFICLLTGTNQDGAREVARKMREAVEALGIPHAFSPVAPTITLSLGVASMVPQRDGKTAHDLFLAADKALYQAKSTGRNKVAVLDGLDEISKPFTAPRPVREQQSILLVDDEQINLNVLKAIFQDTYQTISATSGSQALELARAEPAPDIILLDIQMPDMDGYEVCEALKDDPRTRDIPILFITVMSTETDEAKGLRLGAVDYIPKPFDPSVVHARVSTHLTLRRTLTDLARRNTILEDALNMRDSVERIVRNDLKRPLMDILNKSDRLLATRDLPASLQETVRDIERSGFELLEMIAASIDLWKLERGVYQVDPHPVNLTRIVQNVLRALSPLGAMKNKAVQLITEDAPASIMIRSEELLCYSMLLHLIKNALEADPPGRPVTVTLEHPPRQDTDQEGRSRIRVRIANSGVVPMEIRTRFMEKGATWGKPDGEGLGAYSARLIAETLGATLQVHIDDENQRTEIMLGFSEE
ncbi:response regulator [Desulfonatronum sp. SC1]|uniref:response regulator n=1 Tax=Desulfonatronum sp. SC1 TaxID=2109626 RepID=UPI001304D1CB|nr:response regulator [Desulfonatronum sp. SC1]